MELQINRVQINRARPVVIKSAPANFDVKTCVQPSMMAVKHGRVVKSHFLNFFSGMAQQTEMCLTFLEMRESPIS